MPPKRHQITTAERSALRKYAQNHPQIRQIQLQEWFQSQFGHYLSQGTISDSLSTRFQILDSENIHTRTKLRFQRWLELKVALFE